MTCAAKPLDEDEVPVDVKASVRGNSPATPATVDRRLNEHGGALNAFWLPEDKKEGARGGKPNILPPPTEQSPGPVEAHWKQMGD